jgi:hypothetical protein
MPLTKEAVQWKRRPKAVPRLGAASLSFLAVGASAAIAGIDHPDHRVASAPVARQVMDDVQIREVSLATFHVFDNERVGTQRPHTRPRMISAGACGVGLYYPQNPPAVSAPAYQAPPPARPRPTRRAYRYKRF